jgi:hypothetical protein
VGLETRVLAGLRAHAERRQRRWTLVLAGCAAAVLVVALVASPPRARQSTPEIVQQNPPAQDQVASSPAVANMKQARKAPRTGEVRDVGAVRGSRTTMLRPAVEAREATFPAPAAPLNEQGRLLQAYLRQTSPQQLALMAARKPSTSSLESEDLNIAPLQIADLTPKAEAATKDQDQE